MNHNSDQELKCSDYIFLMFLLIEICIDIWADFLKSLQIDQ